MFERSENVWQMLRGGRVFITGGTGFFGKWLIASLLWANMRAATRVPISVLSRSPERFTAHFPDVAQNSQITMVRGDVATFDFPTGTFSHIIHAATDTTVAAHQDGERLLDGIVSGTKRVLEFAAKSRATDLLFTSSGAVYGEQPDELETIPETYRGAPDTLDRRALYGSAKRYAETLCGLASEHGNLRPKIARCFAFVGPHLALDGHYAIGNFIRDACASGQIQIHGDGRSIRSYLYAADLSTWLWTILVRGSSPSVYNVGSDRSVTIRELADITTATLAPGGAVHVRDTGTASAPRLRYVPNIDLARTELRLDTWTSLPDAIRRTADWHAFEVGRVRESNRCAPPRT